MFVISKRNQAVMKNCLCFSIAVCPSKSFVSTIVRLSNFFILIQIQIFFLWFFNFDGLISSHDFVKFHPEMLKNNKKLTVLRSVINQSLITTFKIQITITIIMFMLLFMGSPKKRAFFTLHNFKKNHVPNKQKKHWYVQIC